MSSPAWQCARCLALNWSPGGGCRACGHPRNAPAPLRVARKRTILSLPHQDFPYSKTHRTRASWGSWVFPAALLAASMFVATMWDPVNAEVSLASARTPDRATAWAARRDELGQAAAELRGLQTELSRAVRPGAPPLADDWGDRLDLVVRRYALHGASADPDLADAEVDVRVVVLELYSLHHRYTHGALDDEVVRRLDAAAVELDRISEDLTHGP